MLKLKLGTKITLGFSLMSFLIITLVFVTIREVNQTNRITQKVGEQRIPTAFASIKMMNGLNHSLASLRAWMILGDEKFKSERMTAWNEEIEPILLRMKRLSKNWTNSKNIERLESMDKDLLVDILFSYKY